MHRITALTSQLSVPALTRRHLLILTGTLAAAVLTALATYVRIPLPFSPVPVTGQTMTVLIAGALLGPVAGPMSQGLFLILGATGLTVFAGGAMTGVTGGYLVGFLFAARIVGLVSRRAPGTLTMGLAMAAASIVILACGAAWLCLVQGLTVGQALAVGVVPFLPGDAMKLLAALAIWRGGAAAWERLTSETSD